MAILDSDPIKHLMIGDMYDVRWVGNDRGPGGAHQFYRQNIEIACTKIRNLLRIGPGTFKLFLSGNFDEPYCRIEEEKTDYPGWICRIWETEEGLKHRAKVQGFIVRDTPLRRPIYTIFVELKK